MKSTKSAQECPVCGNTGREATGRRPRSPYLNGRQFRIVSCTRCGLLLTDPWPTSELLQNVYDSGTYYSTIEASVTDAPDQGFMDRARRAVRSLVVLHHFAPGGAGFRGWLASAIARRRFGWGPPGLSPGKLLDVGCGDGAFLLDARAAGWDVRGLETSQTAVENATRLGLQVSSGSLESHPFEAGEFDVVRLWSVLEHVADSGVALSELSKLLKPGGWAIVQVPNTRGFTARLTAERWPGWDVPVHLIHFTRSTLSRAIRGCGLSLVELHDSSVGTMSGRHPWLGTAPGRMAVFLMDQVFDVLGGGDAIVVFARRPLDVGQTDGK